MSTESKNDLINKVSGFAEKQFKMRGIIRPMYHAFGASDQFFLPAPPGNKDQAIAFIRMFFAAHAIVRYVFVDEAWMLDGSSRLSRAEAEATFARGIANHPQRVEVVIFIAEDDTGALMARRKICRPSNKKPFLEPLETIPMDSMEGRMIGLLPRDPTARTQ